MGESLCRPEGGGRGGGLSGWVGVGAASMWISAEFA